MMRKYALHLAWFVAVMSLLISLFTSSLYDVPVCELCWYQRVCIYPLALILGIAAYSNSGREIIKYTFPLSALAFLLALYQYLQQMVPGFHPIELCGNASSPSCAAVHFKWLGFITYPLLAMLASAIIGVALLMIEKPTNGEKP